jgi:hypothetical protein
VRCSCAAVEAPTSAVPSGPPAVLTRLQSQNPLYRPAGARTEPCAPASSILRLSFAFAACVSACSASTPLVAHPWPARPLRKPLNCLTSRSRAWAAPAYSRRPTLSLPGRTRARPSSSARLPRWTSNKSAMRLDGVDAVHRHDDTTGSNTVALAMRETRQGRAQRSHQCEPGAAGSSPAPAVGAAVSCARRRAAGAALSAAGQVASRRMEG